jgi:uncharacterized protein YkwD
MFGRFLLGSLAAVLLFIPPPALAQNDGDPSADMAEVGKLIVDGTNEYHRQHDLPELKVNDKLQQAAEDFARFMARTDKYSHTADGKHPWERTADHGYESCLVAENIAWEYNSAGFSTRELAEAFLRGWEKSLPHRKNMLDPDLTEIGVGVAHRDDTGRYYAVQDFGRPKSDEIRFQVTNKTDTTVKYAVDGRTVSLEPGYTMTHRTCRVPEVRFEEADKSFHPRSGARYVLRADDQGGYTVEEGSRRLSGGK